MPTTLPEPLAAYFAAQNRHDIDAMLDNFAVDAEVKDEGEERRGRDAIRAWMEETTRKYRPTALVVAIEDQGGTTVVSVLISGTFAGSPARLRYDFTRRGGRIARLEIA
jgi:ketosteroid isomerase-like protein